MSALLHFRHVSQRQLENPNQAVARALIGTHKHFEETPVADFDGTELGKFGHHYWRHPHNDSPQCGATITLVAIRILEALEHAHRQGVVLGECLNGQSIRFATDVDIENPLLHPFTFKLRLGHSAKPLGEDAANEKLTDLITLLRELSYGLFHFHASLPYFGIALPKELRSILSVHLHATYSPNPPRFSEVSQLCEALLPFTQLDPWRQAMAEETRW